MIDKLNPEISTPLYKQLKEAIQDAIRSGEFPPGTIIPSESELIKIYNVGRMTVRKSISELVDEDILTKKQGKGTFVCQNKISEVAVDRLRVSFSHLCKMSGMKPGNHILYAQMRPATRRDVMDLRVQETEDIAYVKLIRYADSRPVMIEEIFFPEKYSRLLNEDLENQSIYEALGRLYGVKLAAEDLSEESKNIISLTTATDQESKWLDTFVRAPLFLVHELIVTKKEGPVYRTKQLISGERFKFTVY